MTEDDLPDIERISIEGRFVVLSDGEVLPITDFFDDEGDDCEPADAVECVAGRDGYGWMTIAIEGEAGAIH
ncbi:hypothetical protein GOA90_25235 [Sinorhizobium meliloti]|nr:hypothetical protein [Sinorhizobium meliloti]